MRPVIAITCDESLTEPRPGRPALPRLELKRAAPDAVLAAGGLPLVLAPSDDPAVVAAYLALAHALVVTGGAFDIPPEEYGEAARPGLGPLKRGRTRFERAVLEGALAAGLPVLGICGGMQLLNVVRGGSLVQHIPAEVPGALQHEQPHDPREPAHEVAIEAGSRLAALCGAAPLPVNTTHHQAVARAGRGLRVCGRAADGVVEAIEDPAAPFVVGVQWHPELLGDRHAALFRGLVERARSPR